MARGQTRGPTLGLAFHPWHLKHLEQLLGHVDFLEVIPESILGFEAGPEIECFEEARSHFPVTFHGVGLGLGGAQAFRIREAEALAALCRKYEPLWVSEHCSFTAAGGLESFELLALPHTNKRLAILCENVSRLQDLLGQRIFLENVSRYVDYRADEMDDCSFLSELARRTGCGLLFDVNNHVINCLNRNLPINHGLHHIRPEDVIEIHFAGHSWLGDFRFDSHTLPAAENVFDLLCHCFEIWGSKPVVLECDDPVVPFEGVRECLSRLDALLRSCSSSYAHQRATPTLKRNLSSGQAGNRQHAFESEEAEMDQRAVEALLKPRLNEPNWTHDLTVETAYRARAYMVSHFSRLTFDLMATCLAPLERAYGATRVTSFLGLYMEKHPPRDSFLYGHLGGLPSFARSISPSDIGIEPRAVEWTWIAWLTLHDPFTGTQSTIKAEQDSAIQERDPFQERRLKSPTRFVRDVSTSDSALIEKMFPDIHILAEHDRGENDCCLAFVRSHDHDLIVFLMSEPCATILARLSQGHTIAKACSLPFDALKPRHLGEIEKLFTHLGKVISA